MAMTMTQKILASHAGLESVTAGQLIEANLDLTLANDITGPVAIREMEKAGFEHVFDKNKIALVMDHFAPNKDIKSAEQCLTCRNFSGKHEIVNFFDVGQMGIEHALLPEKGLVGPGELIIGADSHTCTYGALGAFSTGVGSTDLAVYRSMEFAGDGVASLTMDDRFTICNMAIEAGAKNGIFPVDDKTRAYIKGRVNREVTEFAADPDAQYDEEYTINLSELRPTVACPHLPENTKTVDELGKIEIQQSVIGSCTNVIPATQEIYLQCIEEGLAKIFVEAGAIVSTPTCGPCLGGHMGILAHDEKAISTTNRNFVGRMGHVSSEIYLANPAVAAASAVTGYITDPAELD